MCGGGADDDDIEAAAGAKAASRIASGVDSNVGRPQSATRLFVEWPLTELAVARSFECG